MSATKKNTTARRWVSIAEAAEYAGVSDKTIRRRIADGSLPARRLGRRLLRVELADIDEMMRPVPAGGDW